MSDQLEADEAVPQRADGLPALAPDFMEEQPDPLDPVIPASGQGRLPVVALGGSAGGIQALRQFFDKTPANTGMAFIVVLHLDPEHISTLPELLQRHSAMPVRVAQDKVELEINHVYVIPPGKYLTVADGGHLRLTGMQHERGRRTAVDLLFRSLADTHGPRATAVVLSGADGDGAIGLKRIKERGGLTIAQDPLEAEHSGMPSSAIATGMVDWVLRVDDMPERIIGYLSGEIQLRLPSEDGPELAASNGPPTDHPEQLLHEVLAYLRTRTGHDFSCYKRATVLRRISRRMLVTGVVDLAGYIRHLRTNPGESGALQQDLLISVTNFFRDREAFEVIEGHIPELFHGKTTRDSLRVWCVACATGEEAYSMAMLLLEHARTLQAPPTLQVFGCDLDEQAIRVARIGLYPETIAADVSEERLRRFFTKEAGGWRVRRELREMVLFAAHDLLKDAPFSRMDLVSCRNLLIYLNRKAQTRALEIFNFSLKPGGLLFLGTSESVEEGSALFTPVHKKYRVYRHRPVQRVALPLSTGVGQATLHRVIQRHDDDLRQARASLSSRAFLTLPTMLPNPVQDLRGDELAADLLHFKLLGRFGPASLVVNAEHEIVHISENAHHFLQLPEGEPTRNLLRLVHPVLRVELRAALLSAEETQQPVHVSRQILDLPNGQRAVDIHVTAAGPIAPGSLLVLFETHDPGTLDQPPITDAPGSLEPASIVQQLERELNRTNAVLRSTVEEYEASTEEFKASNEELQAMNEELRSAGEELETGREELQSLNEELTTVNAEYRNRVDELARSNSDLHNLMSATQIATVFLGRELQVMRYTPSAAPLFNLIPGDIGRPIADLNRRLDYPELAQDAEQVLRTLVPVERELRDNGSWYLSRVLPYRTVDDHIAGVVLTFIDTTERRRIEQALRGSEEREAFLHQIGDAVRSTDDPLAIQQLAVRMLGERMNSTRAYYFFVEHDADRAAVPVIDTDYRRDPALESLVGRHAPKAFGNAELFEALDAGKVVEVADVAAIPGVTTDELAVYRSVGTGAFLQVPVLLSGRLVAGIGVHATAPRAWEPAEIALVREVAARTLAAIERSRSGAALRESRARLQLIVDSAREFGIIAMDLDRRITSWNTGAEAIMGYPPDAAIGQPVDMLFTPEDCAAGMPEQESARALAEGRASDERWHLRSDGSRFWASGVMTAMRAGNGTAMGLLKILRDQTGELQTREALELSSARLQTALMEAEAARDRAEAADSAKDRFLAILSHELRAPLTPLLLGAQILERNASLPSGLRNTVDIILRNVRLEAQLIDDLLDVSRIASGKMDLVRHTTTLREIIERAVEVSAADMQAKVQRLTIDLAPGRDALFVDPKRLLQVFWNLLKNASKFTPQGGEITITSQLWDDRVVVQVRDTGIGFEPGTAARIFTAFEQGSDLVRRQYGGLGLGLAIARACVEAHGGSIRAESAGPDRGATLTVELALANPG